MSDAPGTSNANLDPAEVERFARLADEWWDGSGKFRPLHQIGPARLRFIRDQACAVHGRDATVESGRPLAGLTCLDIGCGGGLIAEPMTRMGARVSGIDPAGSGIEAARVHAASGNLEINYRNVTAEALVEAGETYDIVLALEVVEHVPDVAAFVKTCADLVVPGGVLIMSTLNRTLKAYALAIVGAEYVLGWLPRGTHQWERFVTPDELRAAMEAGGIAVGETRGLIYRATQDVWTLDHDTDVNYLMAGVR